MLASHFVTVPPASVEIVPIAARHRFQKEKLREFSLLEREGGDGTCGAWRGLNGRLYD